MFLMLCDVLKNIYSEYTSFDFLSLRDIILISYNFSNH